MAITRRIFALFAALAALAVMPAGALAAAPPAVIGAVSNNTTLSGSSVVAVAGDVAYTTSYWTGQLTAVDISNPSSPTVLGATGPNTNLENGTDVTIAGHYAFVTSKNRNASMASNDDGTGNSLTIVDISNPASPTIVGTLRDPSRLFGAYGVAVSGNFAYVAYQGLLVSQPNAPDISTGGFTVIDITNPGGPTIVANIDNNSLTGAKRNYFDHATSVALSGHYAYVTAFYDARLTVVDISNPSAPSIVTSLRDATRLLYPNNVTVQGAYAYVANQQGAAGIHLAVVSLANPANPVIVGSVGNAILGGSYTVRVSGSMAYLAASGTNTMAAIDISNPTSPRLASYIQDPGHLFSTTGLDVDPTGAYVVAASPRLSTDPRSTYPPFANTTGTISVIQLDPVPISVTVAPSSEPPNPTNQTTANFSFSVADDIATVACKLDNAAFGPCTTNTTAQYAALSNGTHTFTVQATDAAGHTASASYTWTVGTTSGGSPPHNTAPPTVSGAAVQHSQLTGALGSWTGSPAPSLSKQWLRCNSSGSACHAITGATGATYTLTSADAKSRIRLLVRASNTSGSAQAESAATAVVKANPAASLTGVASRHADLSLTGVRVVSALTEVDISLPRGLRFATRHRQLSTGIRVSDQQGKRVAFTAALRRGMLILRLERAVGTAHVTIGPKALGVSTRLASSVKHRRTRNLTLTVSFGLTSGPRFQAALKLPVS